MPESGHEQLPEVYIYIYMMTIFEHAYYWLRLTVLGMLSLWAKSSATSKHHMVVFTLDNS